MPKFITRKNKRAAKQFAAQAAFYASGIMEARHIQNPIKHYNRNRKNGIRCLHSGNLHKAEVWFLKK